MNWIPDPNAKHSAEFVHLSLQSWIPRYQWKNVNPSLASLAQVMGILKNSSKIEEMVSRPQYMFIKDKISQMAMFYMRGKKHL